MIEISIKVSDEDQKLVKKYLHYIDEGKSLTVSHDDLGLKKMVEETIQSFSGRPEDVVVTLKYTW